MEPASAGTASAASQEPLHDLESSEDDDVNLTDAEYAHLLQQQLDFIREEAEQAAAPAPPPRAANQPNLAANLGSNTVVFNLGRCFMGFIILYLSIFSLTKTIIVIAERGLKCERQLHMWAIVQSVLEVLMIIVKAYSYWRVSQPDFQDALDQGEMPRYRGCVAASLAFNRFFNFCFFVWWIVGLAFWFGNGACEAQSLHKVIAAELFIELGVLCLIVLLTIISAVILFVAYWRRPELFRPPNRGANLSDIEKLKEIVFDTADAMGIQTEDAQCAICLSSYESTEKIRYLPCKHHFHSTCIDEWLLKNKTCPFCKRAIDDKGAAATATSTTTTTQEAAENAV